MKAHLHIVQQRVASNRNHLVTMHGLGLRGPRSEVWVKNTPSFRGAIKKVLHLVTVEEVEAAPAPKTTPKTAPKTATKKS